MLTDGDRLKILSDPPVEKKGEGRTLAGVSRSRTDRATSRTQDGPRHSSDWLAVPSLSQGSGRDPERAGQADRAKSVAAAVLTLCYAEASLPRRHRLA